MAQGDYIRKADCKEIYALTQNWKSELLFYTDELGFFRRLIDNYFGWMTYRENLDAVRKLEMDLLKTDKSGLDFLRNKKIFTTIGPGGRKPQMKGCRIFRLEHEHLEDQVVRFENIFRTLRKDVFAVTEHIMESEPMVHLHAQKSKPISA